MNIEKKFFILMLFFLCLSFETYQPKHGWDIHRDDPSLWVKFCDLSGKNTQFLSLLTSQTESVLNEYNQVSTSYVNLVMHPTDLENLDESVVASMFSQEKAEIRTIEICFDFGYDPTASGQGILEYEGDQWTGCNIKLKEDYLTNPYSFQATLLHEMGHCLGLAHPQNTELAIMSYNSSGFNQKKLKIDDKMGLTYLYPADSDYGEEALTFGLGCSVK